MERLEDRLAANVRWVLVGVVAASILFRVAYFIQIDGGLCSQWQRWENGDPNFFDQWGRRIASGDWLTRGSFHPLHAWHKRVAREYFIRNPTERLEIRATGRDPARVLWDRWYGEAQFHQEPLYPWLVGATYRLFGPDPRWVYAWQMVLGVLSNLLIWWLARRHFGERAGLVAAILAVLCGPILFYEWTLVRTSLTVFITLGLAFLFEGALERGSLRRWAVVGVGLGLAILLQTTFVLFGIVGAAWLAWKSQERWRPLAAIAAGAIVCLAPAFVRNAVVGAPLFSLSSVGTVTFVAANWPDTDPTRGWAADDRALALLMDKTGGDFGSAARETLDRHSPGTFVALLWRKSKMLFHDYELPNNKNFLYYRAHAPVLGIGFAGFGLILPFALLGFYAAWKERGRHSLLYAVVATAAAPMLIFYVLARFRAPLTAGLIPFAGCGIVMLAEWIRAKEWKRVAIAAGVIALAGLCLFRSLPPHMRAIRSGDYRVAYETYVEPKEKAAVASSDWSGAAAVLAEMLEDEPAEVRRMDGTPLPEGGIEIREFTDFFSAVYVRRSGYLGMLGQTEASRSDADRAETLHRSLGGVPSAPWTP
ncbi:MAG TPA: glycosyltransferase family 39 protein [Planctomycetota bacterium]|nr:glycosyltransferase family 39 protein [Planctomycetota bacterium]